MKHILIVDDEPKVAFFLRKALLRLEEGYRVSTAASGSEALHLLEKEPVNLVITDLRMPEMSGMELMEHIRARGLPCRLVLMTAYGNAEIEAAGYRLGACRYISKPFSLQELIETVNAALEEADVPGGDVLMLSEERFGDITRSMTGLRFEVGAQCIVLADVTGSVIASVGDVQGLDLSTIVSLAGGSFATASGMARCLGEKESLTLNYHEGVKYEVYSSNVNDDLFLVLIFSKTSQRSRIGIVWLYIRRTMGRLRSLLADVKRVNAGQVLDAEFGTELSASLDELLPDENDDAKDDQPETNSDVSSAKSATESWALGTTDQVQETFNLEQALQMGLLGQLPGDG